MLLCGSTSVNNRVHYHLPHEWNASKDYIYALPFISGIKTLDNSLNLAFTDASFDPSLNVLYVNFDSSMMESPIEVLYLSYMVFTMNSELQISSLVDLSSIPSNINIFVGVSSIVPAPIPVLKKNSTTPTAATPAKNTINSTTNTLNSSKSFAQKGVLGDSINSFQQ